MKLAALVVAGALSGCMSITHYVIPKIPQPSVQAGGSVGDVAAVVGVEYATGTLSLLTILFVPIVIALDYAVEAIVLD